MVIEVREEQFSKASYPMIVTLLGIVIEVREEQSENAVLPIHLVLSLME